MNISLLIYGLSDSLSRITPLKKASHSQDGSNREFRLPLPAPAWDLARRKGQAGRQDVAGEGAVLAQQTAFALGERSNMGSLLLSLATYFQVPPLNTWVLASPKVKLQVCIYVF